MTKNISVEPIEEEDVAPAPQVPAEPSVPKELAEPEAVVEPPVEPEAAVEPPVEPEPTVVEDIQPAPKRRGKPKKEPVPPTDAKKPRGRPKKVAVEQPPVEENSPPPQQPALERATPAFSNDDIGEALQHLLAAHRESKAQKRRDTYSKFNMF